jgi:hypothetical protein
VIEILETKGFYGVLHTITGATITIPDVFSRQQVVVIPVPFVQPLVAIAAGLLKAVDVSLRDLVPVALLTNDRFKVESVQI